LYEIDLNDKVSAIANESKMLAEKVKGLLEVLTKEADKNKREFPVRNFRLRGQ